MTERPMGQDSAPAGYAGGEVVVPASDLQRDWWYREGTYRNPDIVIAWQTWLRGAVDVAALRRAVAMLVARHESLRTTFAEIDGEPVQVVHAELAGDPLRVEDLTGLAGPEREAAVATLVERERAWCFDLRTGPLVRFGLAPVAPDRALLLITIHHIVADGLAFDLLRRELSEFYQRACVDLQATDALAPPRQLREWTLDEREWNQGPEAEAQLAYWRSELDGLAPLRLPVDREPSDPLHYVSAARYFVIPAGVSAGLRRTIRKARATLFLASLTGFLRMLASATGRSDVASVCLVGRRERASARGVIGCVNNVVTVRVQADPGATGVELIRQVRKSVLAAYAHQDIFVSRVWDKVALSPASVDALYIHDEVAAIPDSFGPHSAEPYEHPRPRRYERYGPWWENVKIRVQQDGDNLVGGLFEYNAELYDDATVNGWCADFVEQLRTLSDDPALDPA